MTDHGGTSPARLRVARALAHQEPDRVPLDLNTHAACYSALKQHLGLDILGDDPRPNSAMEVIPHPRVLRALGVDLISIKLGSPRSRPPRLLHEELVEDEWGVGWRRIEQPGGATYLEPVHHPLAGATLADLAQYPWPDPAAPGRADGLAETARELYHQDGLAVVGRFGGPIIETALGLLGWEEWLVRAAGEPDFAGALLDRITEIQMALDQIGLEASAPYLSLFKASGEDLGMQTGPLYSPRTFHELVLPRLSRRLQAARTLLVHLNPGVQIMLHSCGAIRPFIPDLIAAGVQVLDPVQPQAQGMEGSALKRDFGAQITFHGGLDIQDVLPHGTPIQVEAEVRRCLHAFAPGGGYILAPAHAVQPDVPPENIVAMCRAVQRWGQYPLKEHAR
ncbi:MAG: uroporphyrinogen decarboxylase family protein [Anaerolineae bacterium]